MSTRRLAPNLAGPPDDERPKASGIKIIGWLLIVAAIVPLAMAAHGEGRGPLEIGSALVAGGVGLVVAARWPRRYR